MKDSGSAVFCKHLSQFVARIRRFKAVWKHNLFWCTLFVLFIMSALCWGKLSLLFSTCFKEMDCCGQIVDAVCQAEVSLTFDFWIGLANVLCMFKQPSYIFDQSSSANWKLSIRKVRAACHIASDASADTARHNKKRFLFSDAGPSPCFFFFRSVSQV